MCRSINSSDCFILLQLDTAPHYVWFGRGSNKVEQETASALAARLAGGWVEQLHQYNNDEPLWTLLGGQNEHLAPASASEADVMEVRFT